jgi:DNA end-binding protein Ku
VGSGPFAMEPSLTKRCDTMVDPASALGKTVRMARAIWSGSLSFGLVNVPVGLFSATQEKTVQFHQFEAGTSDRIRYKKVNERTGREVENAHIVRGVDLGGGEIVQLTDEELAAADPQRSRTIEIVDFVNAGEIDPLYYRAGYYLGPQGDGARRAYGLLHLAMASEGKVAVATLVMRNKEYLVTIRPATKDRVLVLQTMYFADEVRSPQEEVPNLPAADDVFSPRELAIASQLVEAMTAPWGPENYRDTHRQRIEDLIEAKRAGQEIVTEVAPAEPKVVDLMAALEASVKAVGAQVAAKKTPTKSPRRARRSAVEETQSTSPMRTAPKTARVPKRAPGKKAS